MMSFENLSWPGLDFAAGTVTLPWWAPAAAGALLLLFLLLALFRAGASQIIGAIVRIVAVGVGVWFAWTFIEHAAERDRGEERRAIEARVIGLSAQAVAPGSPLACLDATSGETAENACERAIFASPESVAAATSYLAARLGLYADALDFAARRDSSYAGVLPGLRRTLETDRFGVVAQVFTLQAGCTPDQCDALSILRDPTRVRANLSERTFDMLVARYSAGWPTRGRSGPVSSAPQGSGQGGPSAVGLSFPSAASIPPVSIMSAEPPQPAAAPPSAAPAASAAAPATPARRAPAKQAAPTPRPNPPVQLTPRPSANAGPARAQ